jgi:hypothetical protein
VIAGMCAGADSINDLEVLRAGGMSILVPGRAGDSQLHAAPLISKRNSGPFGLGDHRERVVRGGRASAAARRCARTCSTGS